MTTIFIDISQVTSKSLKDKVLLASFPEYYDLASVTENGLWHSNQNVLNHVIGVYAGLEKILSFNDLKDGQKNALNKYLSEVVGNQTRQNILKVATLLHDIAKTDTLVKWPDGTAWCPGHELIAAGKVKNFSKRFHLDAKSESFVERIVRYHGFISEILNLIIANQNNDKYIFLFKETVKDTAIELTLLMQADLLGSDLEKGDKKGYDDRTALLKWMLDSLLKEVN